MPKHTKKSNTGCKDREDGTNNRSQPEVSDELIETSPRSLAGSSPTQNERPGETPVTKKRNMPEEDDVADNFGMEMQKMLECFGADVTKTLSVKRRRLETLTQTSMKATNKKVEEIWTKQQIERQKLHDEYCRQTSSVFHQWESDIQKTKEQEEKLTVLFKQQQKLFQQARIVQGQRLLTLRQLHEQYNKGLEELGKCHQSQQSSIQTELKKEMSLLQKKILMDTQQQEMANVRKSLQTMLF